MIPVSVRVGPMSRPKRDDVTVKVAASVYKKAKLVAAHREITLAEYLSEILEKPVERDFNRMRAAFDDDATSGSSAS
jgi:hypothetical protein